MKNLSFKKWVEMVKAGKVEDLSAELPDGFLVFGQWMRAKVKIDSTIYFASGWQTNSKPFVTLTPASPEPAENPSQNPQ